MTFMPALARVWPAPVPADCHSYTLISRKALLARPTTALVGGPCCQVAVQAAVGEWVSARWGTTAGCRRSRSALARLERGAPGRPRVLAGDRMLCALSLLAGTMLGRPGRWPAGR